VNDPPTGTLIGKFDVHGVTPLIEIPVETKFPPNPDAQPNLIMVTSNAVLWTLVTVQLIVPQHLKNN